MSTSCSLLILSRLCLSVSLQIFRSTSNTNKIDA